MEEHLSGTKFEIELINAIQKILPKHIKICMDDPDLEYEEYGNPSEVRIKLIFKLFGNIYVVLKDLELVLNFLEKERDKILKHYKFLDSQKTYFKYHFENYFIRLITILDIIGKIGTIIYGLDLNLDKVSAYVFKDKARKDGHDKIAKIVDQLISKLSDFKLERHKKLHTGEADIKPFEGTVIWEDLNSLVGIETDEILKQYTDKKIKEEIEILRTSTYELIDILKEFLDESNNELKKIITTANNAYPQADVFW